MKLQDVIDNFNHELDARAEQAQKEDDAYAQRQSAEDLQQSVEAEGGERTQTEEQIQSEYQESVDTAQTEHVQSDEQYYQDHPSVRAEAGRVVASAAVVHAAAKTLHADGAKAGTFVAKDKDSPDILKPVKKKKKKQMRYDPRNPLTWDPRFRG